MNSKLPLLSAVVILTSIESPSTSASGESFARAQLVLQLREYRFHRVTRLSDAEVVVQIEQWYFSGSRPWQVKPWHVWVMAGRAGVVTAAPAAVAVRPSVTAAAMTPGVRSRNTVCRMTSFLDRRRTVGGDADRHEPRRRSPGMGRLRAHDCRLAALAAAPKYPLPHP